MSHSERSHSERIALLNAHASHRLVSAKRGSQAWYYWRGVLVALEAIMERDNNVHHVTPQWLDTVAEQGRKPISPSA